MQTKFDFLENQMKELGKTVAVQTYQALVSNKSPLVTKADHIRLQTEISLISTQLSTLLKHLHPASNTEIGKTEANDSSPTRNIKRSKPSTPPKSPTLGGKNSNDDYSVSSTTSTHNSKMEGCET